MAQRRTQSHKNTLLHFEENNPLQWGKMKALLFPHPGIPLLLGGKWMGKGGDISGVGVFFVRIATCRFGLRAFILLGLVFNVGIWAEQTPVWPSLPACLSG